ncbi:unnamed protein product [Calicophoron daubneyi]|uniref:EGF-like domain-containing protein n=1 Tax=Calicophoron daubneyi TaxID=300641 RepID=A0AAV2TJZ5_CALDB
MAFNVVCFLNGFILLFMLIFNPVNAGGARANVTLRMGLSYDINPECDETVYKVVICAGEFTNECQLFGPVARFLQAACASQGSPEPLSFLVNSVENPIELDVTVQRVGESGVQRLRRTEFRLNEGGEISVTSFDLTLIVRFHAEYICLQNYFGKLCDKFCDLQAPEHICDEWGNPVCRSGFFIDQKAGKCRQDKCLLTPGYCRNGGTCINNPDKESDFPFCLCPPKFAGSRCEFKQTTTVITDPTTLTTTRTTRATTETLATPTPAAVTVSSTQISRVVLAVPPGPGLNHSRPFEIPSNPLKGAASNQTVGRLTHGPERKNFQTSDESGSPYRKILLPFVIITLILALLTACIGFLVWAMTGKNRKKKRIQGTKGTSRDSADLDEVPKRWASVDQSPTRYYCLDNQNMLTHSCLPSLNGSQVRNFSDHTEPEVIYGTPMQSSFIPSRYSALDAQQQQQPSQPCSDPFWNYEGNHFATLPRNFCTLPRHSIGEYARTASFRSPGAQYTAMHPASSPIEQYLRTSAIVDSSMVDPRKSALLTLGSPEENHLIYDTSNPRAPSIHSAYVGGVERPPPITPFVYGPFGTGLERSFHQQMTRPELVLTTDPQTIVNNLSTSPAVGHTNTLSNQPPPPPTEFADGTYMRSAC